MARPRCERVCYATMLCYAVTADDASAAASAATSDSVAAAGAGAAALGVYAV